METLKEEVEILAWQQRLLQERYAELEQEQRDTESRGLFEKATDGIKEYRRRVIFWLLRRAIAS